MTAPGVVLATGHRVDLPDRPTPRFPAEQVPRVTAQVRAALAEWPVGPGSTAVSGGARGADLIIAEEAQALGARILLCLALPLGEFLRRSVDVPGTDWAARFARLARLAEVHVVGDEGGDGIGDARANDWMIQAARSIDPRPQVIAVWDGQCGTGPGGTADMVQRLGVRPPDPRVRLIAPMGRSGAHGDAAVTPAG